MDSVLVLLVAARHLHHRALVFFNPRALIKIFIFLMQPVDRDKCTDRCVPCDQVLEALNLLRVLAVVTHSGDSPSAHKMVSVGSLSIDNPTVPFADCKYIVSRIGKANDQF